MVDAIDRLLGEVLVQRAVQRARRLEIAAERLFHDDARILIEAALSERRADRRERRRWDGKVVQRPLCPANRLLKLAERILIVVVAADILQELDQTGEVRLPEAPVLLDALFG